jgi:DNA modification methylase
MLEGLKKEELLHNKMNGEFLTNHKIIFSNSNNMNKINSESVDLMITSPPYPMIKMWDDIFSSQNKEIKNALNNDNGNLAFELMNKELDKVWKEVYRVLKIGGIACINIGDATRSINNKFQIYVNHARILNYCLSLGFHALPEVLWVKETNKPDKFMGSGMLPVGAYITLEHEHILILRKEGKRDFNKNEQKKNRQKSAFFWEERNAWFSDKWKDIKGIFQKLENSKSRERSGAYPFELAYRLINMFSVQGDIILDPFLGTGTTTIAAIASGRNSIGIEIDNNFKEVIEEKINNSNQLNNYIEQRIQNHKEFINKRIKDKGETKYINSFYNFPVMTNQETNIQIPKIKNIINKENNLFEIEHLF